MPNHLLFNVGFTREKSVKDIVANEMWTWPDTWNQHVWQCIRDHGNEVDWFHIVWSKVYIPRHAIHLWLVMRRRLLTQDKLRQWDVGNSIDLNLLRCPLCNSQPDSHDHLFFECTFASLDWSSVVQRADIGFSSSRCRLVLAASAYYVWPEQNNKIYGKGHRTPDQVALIVLDTVRLKLTSTYFKKRARVEKMKKTLRLASILSDVG
ncbi:lupus La protein [Tanacetum coccineum]|uniref:Lupus La protein n=1 Tax=Tanacetum coccineum TaxID=301880 RepID=A0ABQ5D9L5_9ASTR